MCGSATPCQHSVPAIGPYWGLQRCFCNCCTPLGRTQNPIKKNYCHRQNLIPNLTCFGWVDARSNSKSKKSVNSRYKKKKEKHFRMYSNLDLWCGNS